ncbi:M20/M25/M40 family metallo-hydrolase [Haloferax sp. MBLA0076]|uniref:M20/M25/M40 family metallo-hydrolase n=1 Tax=Haloferax litoreum TaxID=2666140 RepID=A0A6A8GK40_9EURY|nr:MULTISPECIES: M20 family metallopeptidase [Haloferax]KAB1190566.1 M20 family metallopeptidase [Haloferax sp. CBA1148]MRX23553.1 M20/M25/M40 family metallo-hydrolase [Haloferax litoreum]
MSSDTTTETDAGVASAIDPDETIEVLQDLVQIPSPFFEEEAIATYIYDWLDERGLDPEYHTVSEPAITGFEGDNVVARIEGSDPEAPTVLLNGHMDTVQHVEGWDEDPTSGRIEDGKLYGQGACDMKGGLAAILVAFEALAERDLDGDVLLTAVVDEEGPFGLGTDATIRDGVTTDCDVAIVTEPAPTITQQDIENPAIVLGARGRFLYEITVTGKAAHGSQPDMGVNAALDAARIADAISEMDLGHHEKLGSGSVCLLSIEGGGEPLSVPDQCELEIDRHVVPGETAESVLEDAQRVVDSLDLESDVDISLRETPEPDMYFQPYVTDENDPLVTPFFDSIRELFDTEPDVGYFSSIGDFNHLGGRAEIPTVIVGPDGANVHGTGEYVYVDEVVETAQLVADATSRLVE